MKAHARLTACFDGSRTVLRELRSMAPLTLFPRRASGPTAVVHLVNSATSPLGGDDLLLSLHVGPGASLRVSGVAARNGHGSGSIGRDSLNLNSQYSDDHKRCRILLNPDLSRRR